MTALITGAAGAIGKACVTAFLAAGHDVIAQDLNAAGWQDTPGVTAISGNLLDSTCRQQLTDAAEHAGLHAVVAAHGVAGSAVLADCTPEFVDRVLTVNATTVPLLYTAIRGPLAATNGAFIAIASQAALIGEAGNTAYCAAKFAVLGWITAMAARPQPVTFHALCPGATNSALLITAQRQFAAAEGITADEYYQQRAQQIAVGRYGEPEEIAAAATYLAGNYRRPTVLAVTGGDILH